MSPGAFKHMPAQAPTRLSPVLVVEDEALVRLCIADFLHEAGFEVIDADSAASVLNIMAPRPDVRVLFTDVQLPGAPDGMELARMIHERWPHVLLLVTSGYKRPPAEQIADHGRFLPKPYMPEEVIREIEDLAQEADARRKRR